MSGRRVRALRKAYRLAAGWPAFRGITRRLKRNYHLPESERIPSKWVEPWLWPRGM